MKAKSGFMALALLALVLSSGMALPAQDRDDTLETVKKTGRAFSKLVKSAVPAVVFIKVEKQFEQRGVYFNDPYDLFGEDMLDRFFGMRAPRGRMQPRRFLMKGQGSGFIISKDGYILTNNHVVGDADKISVKLKDGREFTAKRIGSDPGSEVALIKIDADNLPFLEAGDSDKIDIGEWVIAVGNPFGLAETVTIGVISAKGRNSLGLAEYEDFIQTDAAINPGNSGGPLLDIDGKAIGINTAIFSQSGGYSGIGFAIPINMAMAVKEQMLKNKGAVVRGFLGIKMQELTRDLAEMFGVIDAKGVLVAEVIPGSEAEKAGIKQGDIITAIDGAPVLSASDFRNRISLTPPSAELTLKVFRDRKEMAIKTRIGHEQPEPAEVAPPEDEEIRQIGLDVAPLTPEVAARLGYEGESGVVAVEVKEGSLAENAEIRPGNLIVSVNRKPVKDARDFAKAVADFGKSKLLLLLVKDAQSSRYVLLRSEQ